MFPHKRHLLTSTSKIVSSLTIGLLPTLLANCSGGLLGGCTYLYEWARKNESRTCWYFLHPSAQDSRYLSPASVTEYLRHGGRPEEVLHVLSQSPSCSIFLSAR